MTNLRLELLWVRKSFFGGLTSPAQLLQAHYVPNNGFQKNTVIHKFCFSQGAPNILSNGKVETMLHSKSQLSMMLLLDAREKANIV